MKVSVDREGVYKEAQEPVQGEERRIHSVSLKMICQGGKLLCKQLLEHSLVYLGPDQLLGVVVGRHHHINNVDHQPEGVLLIEEQQGDGCYSIKTLHK